MSVGEDIRAARETLGLSQAAIAQLVGTTQQTVDRIERGETTHSRFVTPIVSILTALESETRLLETAALTNDRLLEARMRQAEIAKAEERSSREPLASRIVETRVLMPDGELQTGVGTTSLPFGCPDTGEDRMFGLVLRKSVLGPSGDIVFQRGDTLIVSPLEAPRHFDWAFIPEGDKHARLALVIDPDVLPAGDRQALGEFSGYEILDLSRPLLQQRVIARYMQ